MSGENSQIAPPQRSPVRVDKFEQAELIDLVNNLSRLNPSQNILNSIDIPEGDAESERITFSTGELAKDKNVETAEQFGNFFRDIQQISNKGPMQFYFINKL